ncbi:MAG: gliding motility-associated C-terminal domain-containing protein [Bacteroidetes bacterium]|nr:gliding motility-associated C-terminal domain-containing protein [Bacteroidota bacterium]
MPRRFFLLLCLLSLMLPAFATHQRAAEITYRWINGLTYEVTITMYTYTPSLADDVRTSLPIFWGDNSGEEIPRIVFEDLPDNYTLNVYRQNHTFPAPGAYIMAVEDPNRNFGVVNIPNSVNVPMFVESELIINPFLGNNNSVQLLNPPVDQGCVGKLFMHNPSAYDPDGDSLSYRLVKCKGAGGYDIPGYSFPLASSAFSIDAVTGDMSWDSPMLQGEYNVAFVVEEWRNGIKVGSVTRDMQILIGACDNNPPEIVSIDDTCVLAGNTLLFDVTAIDPDRNNVVLTANGGPFEVSDSPAAIVPDPAEGNDTVTTTFFWNTTCNHVRKSPYNVLFKARDQNPIVSLTTLKTVTINVIAPAVDNLATVALGNGIDLSWNVSVCQNSLGYRIYRRSGSSGYQPSYCETGVPPWTGYHMIREIANNQTTSYRDDDNGLGLTPGISYCYLITAYFQDGAESQASNEACASLKRDLPVMTHVSNDSLDLEAGRALTAWSKPTELDTIQYPGPYRYKLTRSSDGNPATMVFTGIGLNDTLFTDNGVNLNTSAGPYVYQVSLESETVGAIGSGKSASSLYISLTETDQKIRLNWAPQVPWINDSVEVFRQNPGETVFSLIGSSATNSYDDSGLENELQYCYYIRSFGAYSVPGIIKPIVNYSQLACGTPRDNVPPCAPILSVSTDCETVVNTLSWTNPFDSCSYDISRYLIYYTPSANQEFTLVDSVIGKDNLTYQHLAMEHITGCYYIKAIDAHSNISASSNIACVDYVACPVYELPNFFTPNGDQINDVFIPLNYPSSNPKANVSRVEMTIFNRWGNKLFETTDPMINWDGKSQRNGKDCTDGVYFYVCTVYFMGFDGLVEQQLQGSITIIR